MKAPERAELEALVQSVSERVGRHLERQGLLVRDAENGYLALEPKGEDALANGCFGEAGMAESGRLLNLPASAPDRGVPAAPCRKT